jgi:hypothetical protein
VARIPETFNFGDTDGLTIEELVIKFQRMYTDLAEAINSKPDLVQRDVDGQTGDTFLAQGTININLSTDKVEMLTNHIDPTTVTWTQLS